jgi:hypothetical protein
VENHLSKVLRLELSHLLFRLIISGDFGLSTEPSNIKIAIHKCVDTWLDILIRSILLSLLQHLLSIDKKNLIINRPDLLLSLARANHKCLRFILFDN